MEAPLSGDPPAGRGGESLSTRWVRAETPRTLPDRIRSWLLADAPAAPAGVAGLQVPLAVTLAVFAAAFLVPAWPWLSGRVTIPWDAKSQFFPQLQFLATSIAHGEWPWWTPNVFAGWPQISDPQSLMFSPLHVLLALFNSAISLRAFDAVIFAYLCLGGIGIILFFRDRGWHAGGAVVAALAFAFGGAASARLQHIGQVMSLVYMVLVLWLLARALDRGSWRAGLAAGAIAGLMAIGRDQVALLSLYVLAGYVAAHWFVGAGVIERMRASVKPLAAVVLSGTLLVAVPVVMTTLLAARSNRPEISFATAAAGSIHPLHLLQLVFADLFAAMDPNVEYWGPDTPAWDAAWGRPGLYFSQNMPLVYAGALPVLAIVSFGLIRGLAWSRDIRFFAIAAALMLFYAIGTYTPVFHLMYELPFVALYRRALDATFVLCALLAILAGYLVHRWLSGTVPPATRAQRAMEIGCAAGLIVTVLVVAFPVVGLDPVIIPVVTAVVFTAASIGILVLARQANAYAPLLPVVLLALFIAVDLRWNNAPHISTAMPREHFEALRQGTHD